MFRCALILSVFLTPLAALADNGGTLNPEEMSFNSVMAKAIRGKVDMVACSQGYHITKAGRHAEARILFRRCVDAGYTGAMTWMSQLDDNGLGGPEDAKAAAAWDKMAAYAGDPIGMFNYGLDLIRGRGVQRDIDGGRAFIDKAATSGLKIAQELQDADYDVETVTPDADNWKYRKYVF